MKRLKNRLLKKIDGRFAALAGLVLFGAWARCWDLAWHFAHSDDIGVARTILQAKSQGVFGLFAVPANWTYAPFQFLFTSFLVHPGQSYRELLFWARLPSCVFSIAGLVSLVFLYRTMEGGRSRRVFLALALLACSWEAIIHAKQMHNYGLGVWASILLLQLLMFPVIRRDFTFRRLVLISLGLALVSSMQYQILFFVPAFFAALFTAGLGSAPARRSFVKAFAGSVLLYAAAVGPMVYFFLRHRSSGVYDWCSGPQGEFLLSFGQGASWLAKITHSICFFSKNLFIVFQSNTAFLPEGHPLMPPISAGLFILFMLGGWSFLVSREAPKRVLALFFAGVAVVWAALVFFQKITFGPTRHSLILLPVMIILTAEGAGWLSARIKKVLGLSPGVPWTGPLLTAALGGILILFTLNFESFLRDRKDAFDERALLSVMQQYQPRTLMTVRDTYNPSLMKSVQAFFAADPLPGEDPFETVAWISHRDKLSMDRFLDAMEAMHAHQLRSGDLSPILRDKLEGFFFRGSSLPPYRVVYALEQNSQTEVDYSSRTKNGGNSLYFYVLQKESAAV